MAKIVNEKWKADMESRIFQNKEIDVTSAFKPAIQWLVVKLATLGIEYKLYNLGAGVTRLTTNTTVCPCCKKTL